MFKEASKSVLVIPRNLADQVYDILDKAILNGEFLPGEEMPEAAIAEKLGCKGYQAVGNALNKNPFKSVPCHRVVKSNLEVGGFARGTKNKIKLLKKEGIKVSNNQVPVRFVHQF